MIAERWRLRNERLSEQPAGKISALKLQEGMMLFESAAAAEAFLNQRSAGLEQEFDHANHHTAYLMCTPL